MCSIYKLYQTEHVNYTSIKIGFKSDPIMIFKKERERKGGKGNTSLYQRPPANNKCRRHERSRALHSSTQSD